jgi:hypothetical protein
MEPENRFSPPKSNLDGIVGVPGQSIRYQLTRWDLFKGQVSVNLRHRVAQIAFLASFIFSTVSSWTDSRHADESAEGKVLVVLVNILSLTITWGVVIIVMVGLMVILTKGKRSTLGEHTLTIKDNGLEEETIYNVTLHKWFGIQKLVKRGRYRYIYITESLVHIVPPQSKMLEGDVDVFAEAVKTRIAQSNEV